MKKIFWICLIVFPLLMIPSPVQADGIIIPPVPPCDKYDCPPLPRPMMQLEIRYHHVSVTIDNQLAKTRVDQVFSNPNDWEVEGTYVFPLPLDAVVSDFTLWVDGKPVSGEVLSADEARSYYEEIVNELKDPALLEYIERGALRASIYPIPPQGERRIELEYTQTLAAQNGLVRYIYPLNTEKFSLEPLQDVSISVDIRDRQPIRAIYSPSHSVGIYHQDENRAHAGYEEKNVLPDSDFALYYSVGESEAFHIFTYRDPADPVSPDGFFLLMLAPKPEITSERVAKDVLLVLDRSGSMEGEKFQQAQSALRYILQKLNPEDRFYLQAFSTGLDTYASGLCPASEVNEALDWVDRLSPVGSTDINRALLEAVSAADPDRLTYLIFLTDGLPTEGVVDTSEILANFAQSNRQNLRLFSFGVGYDVDTVLLDTLSQENHGQSTYVRPDEALDEVLSGFYERISMPVLTDLHLDFGDLNTYDMYPDPLPDLFSGSQIIVTGRYIAGGKTDVVLTGEVNGKEQEFVFAGQEFSEDNRGMIDSLDSLPRLWATRKIGYLLNRVRLEGPDQETIQQIVSISIRYGIITPYTSYLVTDTVPLGAEEQNRIVQDQFSQAQEAPPESYGKEAVERAAQESEMQDAGAPMAVPQAEGENSTGDGTVTSIRVVGTKTFVYQDGVWVDTLYDPQEMKVQKIEFLSDEYFQFLGLRLDMAGALALGDKVILVVDGKAYQVGGERQADEPLDLPDMPVENQATPVPEPTSPLIQVETEAVQPATTSSPSSSGRKVCLSVGLIPLGVGILVLRKRRPL